MNVIPLVKIGLNFIGAWPGASSTKLFVLLLAMFIFSLIFQISNLLLVFHELDLLMNNLATTMPVVLIVFKLSMLRLKFKDVKILINEMVRDGQNEKHVDVRKVMVKNRRIAVFLSNIITICYNGLVISFVVIAATSYGSKSIDDRQFVIQATYPINGKKSPTFEILCLLQIVVAFFGTNGHAVLEGLLTISVLHANTKASSVCKEISNYSEACLSVNSKKHILNAKQKLIEKHLQFLHFTDCIESIFTNVSFFHVFFMTFINCTVGYMLINIKDVNQNNIFTLFMCIAYMLTALSAVLSYCAAGEYVKSQGEWIFQELCKCPWYGFKTNDVKTITFMIMKSSRPVTITVGYLGDLSLIYFTKIIKTSVSYLSLVRAVSK